MQQNLRNNAVPNARIAVRWNVSGRLRFLAPGDGPASPICRMLAVAAREEVGHEILDFLGGQ
jgi:hypothetical protein